MEEPQERVEVGLDAQTDQITIVVGTDQNAVQSVVVLSSQFSPIKQRRLGARQDRSSSTKSSKSSSLSEKLASIDAKTSYNQSTNNYVRSVSRRPESPISLRSSFLEGRLRCDRSLFPSLERHRGRDSAARDDHNTRRHTDNPCRTMEPRKKAHAAIILTSTTTATALSTLSGPTRASLLVKRGNNHRKTKGDKHVIDPDSRGYNNKNNLPPIKDSIEYIYGKNPNQSKPKYSYRNFRHHRVDPVLGI